MESKENNQDPKTVNLEIKPFEGIAGGVQANDGERARIIVNDDLKLFPGVEEENEL